MGWNVPLERLSQKQLAVLDGITRSLTRPHWVKGFAGTGKTVVLSRLIERVAAEHPASSLCFLTYTHALKDMVATAFHGDMARRVRVMTHKQFLSEKAACDYVFLDEVQDIPPGELLRIRARSKHFVIAGDPDQSIYTDGADESDINRLLEPDAWALVEMFRLTPKLASLARTILPSSRIVEGIHDGRTRNADVHLFRFPDESSEASWVWSEANRHARQGSPSVILLPTHKAIRDFGEGVARGTGIQAPEPVKKVSYKHDYDPWNRHWQRANLNLRYFGGGHGSLFDADSSPMVYVMTYHGSKGLDFATVFLPGLREGTVIVNAQALAENPLLDRRLLFVAVTRSRERLFMTFSGDRPHKLLGDLEQEIPPTSAGTDLDDEEFF